MAIAYDNSSSNVANDTSVSTTLTVGTLTNGVMYIFCADLNESDTITTPTVGGSSTGVALVDSYTQDPALGGIAFVKVYRKKAPSAGSTAVAFTASSNHLAIGVITFSGVDQTTPDRTPAHERGNSSGPSVSVTTVSGDIVAEFFAWPTTSNAPTFTNDGSQTSRQHIVSGGQGLAIAQETASGTSTTASGTLSGSTLWAALAVPLIAASGGAGQSYPLSGKLSSLLGGKL